MKRKVVKLDKDGKEVKDRKGNFIFEEIEVEEPAADPDPTPSEPTIGDLMGALENINKAIGSMNSNDEETKALFEETKQILAQLNKGTKPDPANPPKDPTIADAMKTMDEISKKLGVEPSVVHAEKEPPKPEPPKSSLGFDPRTGSID